MQLRFRNSGLFPLFLVASAVLASHAWMSGLPDRKELGRRTASVRFEPVQLDAKAFLPFRLAGAWTVKVGDPRFGGVSAIAVERGQLLALSDSGVLVRLPKPDRPSATAILRELHHGPSDPSFKRNSDSEALLRDPDGRGWWVAFEVRHSLWLYDPSFDRTISRIDLGGRGWRENAGVEALVADDGSLLLFPELGAEIVTLSEGRLGGAELASGSRIADAATLPDGRIVVLQRQLTWRGFRNRIAWLKRNGGSYRVEGPIDLGVGPLDNMEALAVEQTEDGIRLWLMSDDNFNRWQRTLLLALDIPEDS